MSIANELKSIETELIKLTSSPLYSYRVKNGYFPVIGEGGHDSRIMFVGEAPGENEAKTGKPFCGRSGKVLDELLHSIGLERERVYITSVVKDRPPGNRDPKPNEIDIYGPFLDRQIEIMRPKVIATLGRHSLEYIFAKYGLSEKIDKISKIHGQKFKGKASYGDVIVVALYHPAATLHNGSMKAQMIKDFKALNKYK